MYDDESDAATTTASTGWDLPTPSHTVVSDTTDSLEQDKIPDAMLAGPVETVPEPWNTYVIRARDSGRAITLVNGELKLLDWDCAGDKSSHWQCEERGGWFSFKNPVSNTYMGHNGGGVLHAKAGWHLLWENFSTKKHPDGGFVLLNSGWLWWDGLKEIAVDESGYNLVHWDTGGTVWEFLKV